MILVTGATGLVGSHLIKALVKQGKKVKAVYHYSSPVLNSENITWVKADILDICELDEVMQDAEQVYHCAAMVSFYPGQKKLLHQINVEGTANVVNACLNKGVRKLLHVSSVSALGRMRKNTVIDETMNWSEETSNSEYGKTKYLAEMEVWRGIGEGLQAVMVNPAIILGASDWSKGSSAIFKNAYHEFAWYTEGVTGFVDVQDVVRAMIMLMESDVQAQRFILSAENISYKKLFSEVALIFGKNPPHRKVTPLIAEIVWRMEHLKTLFTNKKPLVTRETARTAQAEVYFDNSKLLQYFSNFTYTPLGESLKRICNEFEKMYSLP